LDFSLKNGEKQDINGVELISELNILRHKIAKEFIKSIEVLQFIIDLQNTFPNASIAYRLLLTTSISVASME